MREHIAELMIDTVLFVVAALVAGLIYLLVRLFIPTDIAQVITVCGFVVMSNYRNYNASIRMSEMREGGG